MNKIVIGVVIIVVVIGGFLLFSGGDSGNVSTGDVDNEEVNSPNLKSVVPGSWIDAELKDVNSQETFKISDFSDDVVLVESFAVWCPTCTRQQKIIKEFDASHSEVVSISLDTDPNEDEQRVIEHTTANGFDWRYAVSPEAVTRSLVDDFGTGIVNAPSVPMILVCDGNAYELPRGIKDVGELESFISICN